MKMSIICHKFCLLIILLSGCLERYEPPVIRDNPEFLVVDAFINVNDSTANAIITRSAILGSGLAPEPETNAQVTIEEEGGTIFQLTENKAGAYDGAGLNPDMNKKYRLHIITRNSDEYLSDFITLKNTPPIEDLSWNIVGNGVQIHLDTRDPEGKSQYYKWNYEETWEYNAPVEAKLRLVNGIFTYIKAEESVYTCWRTIPGTHVLVTTTNRLRQDVVNDFKIQFIPAKSIYLSKKYSIIVQQQTLSEDGYNYWLTLQKTTEDLGSLFDPMPSQVIGNIYCVNNPDEPVIGYFDGGSISEKRIFIDANDLPGHIRGRSFNRDCTLDSVIFDNPSMPTGNASFVVSNFSDPTNPKKNGYLKTSPGCYNCTSQGGVTVKPGFWE